MKICSFFVVFIFASQVFAESIVGEVFEQKTNFSHKLYNLIIEIQTTAGLTQSTAEYRDPQGQLVVQEKGLFKGDELVSFEVNQMQTHEKGRVEVQGEKIIFTYEKDGKSKTSQEKLKRPLLSSANFNAFVRNHWKEIISGSEIEVRFAVWFRRETVGFKILKTGEVQKGTRKWIQLRMTPSSFVVAALVDPLTLWYSEDTKQLMELSGRVPPKIKSGEKFKDLDSDVRYTQNP